MAEASTGQEMNLTSLGDSNFWEGIKSKSENLSNFANYMDQVLNITLDTALPFGSRYLLDTIGGIDYWSMMKDGIVDNLHTMADTAKILSYSALGLALPPGSEQVLSQIGSPLFWSGTQDIAIEALDTEKTLFDVAFKVSNIVPDTIERASDLGAELGSNEEFQQALGLFIGETGGAIANLANLTTDKGLLGQVINGSVKVGEVIGAGLSIAARNISFDDDSFIRPEDIINPPSPTGEPPKHFIVVSAHGAGPQLPSSDPNYWAKSLFNLTINGVKADAVYATTWNTPGTQDGIYNGIPEYMDGGDLAETIRQQFKQDILKAYDEKKKLEQQYGEKVAIIGVYHSESTIISEDTLREFGDEVKIDFLLTAGSIRRGLGDPSLRGITNGSPNTKPQNVGTWINITNQYDIFNVLRYSIENAINTVKTALFSYLPDIHIKYIIGPISGDVEGVDDLLTDEPHFSMIKDIQKLFDDKVKDYIKW